MSTLHVTAPRPWWPTLDANQQAHLNTSLMAMALYVVCALVQSAEAWLGLIDAQASMQLALTYLGGASIFVLLIRSGLAQRFQSDPALLQVQSVFAVAATSGSYLLHGPLRGAIISLVAMILVFGMFYFTARQALRVSGISLVLLGGMMGLAAYNDPLRFPPLEEWAHFSVASVVLIGIAVLSVKLAGLRQRLTEKNAALSVALEQIRRLATSDDLTGLFNRRHMAELLGNESARQKRTGNSNSLALIDIDFFKRVNDEHGHASGDAVLKAFAQAAGQTLRASDVLARWGGEEFLLLLPDTEVIEAQACVQRMREQVNALSLWQIHPALKVTFSAGVSVTHGAETVEQAVERADQAMYQAKRAGRDCTVVG